ncbi:hypothetical protein ACQ4PT_018917 [Festuca glaucescens]
MVKKKSVTAAASAATSATGPKAATTAPKKTAADAAAAIVRDAPGDWTASTMTKHDEKKARSLGLISNNEGDVILLGSDSRPNPPAGFTIMFAAFLYRGLSLPGHEFLRCFLLSYGIQLWQLTPNSILHLAIFITTCEAFLGIDPHWGLWKKIFFVKRYSSNNGPFITGGVGFVVRKEVPATVKYFPAVSEVEEDPEDAPGMSTAQPPKRPSGGFADEDDLLFDSDEGFAEPPSKKAKTSSSRPAPAVSEAPALSVPAASSFPKGKENPSAPGEHSIQAVITIIKDFASQFTLLQAENARLQQDAKSKSAQLDEAVKIAATARQEADSLKKELGQLKKKLKEEEKNKTETQVQTKEKEDKLRSSITALLGATDIPVDSVGKPPADSAADAISLAVDSGELV